MITNIFGKSALATVMRTDAWLRNLMALFVCAALFAVWAPQVKAAEAAPSIFIDSVLPHPGPDNVVLLDLLPVGAENRTAALWNWDGLSPVSVQAVFQTFNSILDDLDFLEIFVNDQLIPEFVVSTLYTDNTGFVSPDGLLDQVLDFGLLDQLKDITIFKVSFVVPYEIPADDLKAHLTIRIAATFTKDLQSVTLEAIKHVTLLNNPNLFAQFDDIQAQLDALAAKPDDFQAQLAALVAKDVTLTAADAQFCTNDTANIAIAGTLRDAIGLLSVSAISTVGAANTALTTLVGGINTIAPAVVGGANTALGGAVTGANTALGTVVSSSNTALATVVGGINSTGSAAVDGANTALATVVGGINSTGSEVVDVTNTALGEVVSSINSSGTAVVAGANTALGTVVSGINTTATALKGAVQSAINAVIGRINTVRNSINGVLNNLRTFDLNINTPNPQICFKFAGIEKCKSINIPNFTIDNILSFIPNNAIPAVSGVTLGSIPTISAPTIPAIPTILAIAVPAIPTILAITIPATPTIPAITIAAITPISAPTISAIPTVPVPIIPTPPKVGAAIDTALANIVCPS